MPARTTKHPPAPASVPRAEAKRRALAGGSGHSLQTSHGRWAHVIPLAHGRAVLLHAPTRREADALGYAWRAERAAKAVQQ